MKRLILTITLQVLVVMFAFPMIHKDFKVQGDVVTAIKVVVAFIIFNVLLRFLLKWFTLGIGPIVYFLSLGLAGLLVNAFVLLGVAYFLPDMLKVPGFTEALIGGVLLALANFIAS